MEDEGVSLGCVVGEVDISENAEMGIGEVGDIGVRLQSTAFFSRLS